MMSASSLAFPASSPEGLNPAFLATRKEGNVLFNDALNTFYLRLYGIRHMVKDHSDSERGNPLPPHGLLFPINCKGSFICTISQRQDSTYHGPLLHQSWITGWNDPREETHCHHYMGNAFRLTARVLLYAPSPTDRIAHTTGLCYTSRGALAGTTREKRPTATTTWVTLFD